MLRNFEYVDFHKGNVILYNKDKEYVFEYSTIELYDKGLEVDGIYYNIRFFNRDYLTDKLRNNNLGMYTVKTLCKSTIRLSMVYPIYTITDKYGRTFYGSYTEATLEDNVLSFRGTDSKRLILRPDADFVVVESLIGGKKLTSANLFILSLVDTSFIDKVKRLIFRHNYIRVKILDTHIYVYDDIIFSTLGKSIIKG